MSKLAAYMQLLTHDRAEHDKYYEDRAQAMTQFGLSEVEQRTILSGDPTRIRTAIVSADEPPKPKPKPITTKPKPKPPVPITTKPTKPKPK